MKEAETYDCIRIDYVLQRRPDHRWTVLIQPFLRDHRTLVNVGAGAGSYEPAFMSVVGVEPSLIMIQQRSPSSAQVLCGVAENLPFTDGAFDVALAVFSLHH